MQALEQILSTRLRGRVRVMRGRCPSCSSDFQAAASCEVCRGYRGPFPAEARTLLRWSGRFGAQLRAVQTKSSDSAQLAWPRVSAPLTR